MKTIRHTATLFYYDGPQVFEAKDSLGGHYLGVMVPPDAADHRVVVFGIEPTTLQQFREGLLELRDVMLLAPEQDWLLGGFGSTITDPLRILRHLTVDAVGEFLPDPGFVLHQYQTETAALSEARSRNNLVLEVSVDPPEASEDHKIRVGTLVGLLGNLQMLLKHAYGAARRELSYSVKRSIDRSNSHLLDVIVPASPGSFRIVMEATKRADMFGRSELFRALELVDKLFSDADNTQKALESAKEHRGHLAAAYLRLLRFLVEHKTGLRYAWAEPAFTLPKRYAISRAQAEPLVDALSSISNLGAEPVELVGTLEKADVVNGTWRVATPEESFAGKIKPGGPSLNGLKIGSRYKFSCLEEIEELEGTGRELRTLYLTEHGLA